MQNGAPNPAINLSMNTTVTDLSPDLKEVILKLQLEAKVGETTLWLAELQQAGAFAWRNVPPEDLQRLIGIFCPQYLLPYARQTISDLLLKGGFPRLACRRSTSKGCLTGLLPSPGSRARRRILLPQSTEIACGSRSGATRPFESH